MKVRLLLEGNSTEQAEWTKICPDSYSFIDLVLEQLLSWTKALETWSYSVIFSEFKRRVCKQSGNIKPPVYVVKSVYLVDFQDSCSYNNETVTSK